MKKALEEGKAVLMMLALLVLTPVSMVLMIRLVSTCMTWAWDIGR